MERLWILLLIAFFSGCASSGQSSLLGSLFSHHGVQIHTITPRFVISSHSVQRSAPSEVGRRWGFDDLVQNSGHLSRGCDNNWCWEFSFASAYPSPPKLPLETEKSVRLANYLASYLSGGEVIPLHASIYLIPPSDSIDDVRLLSEEVPSLAYAFHYVEDGGGGAHFKRYRNNQYARIFSALMHEIQHLQFMISRSPFEDIRSIESLRRNEAVSVCWERASRAMLAPLTQDSMRVSGESRTSVEALERVVGRMDRGNVSLLVPGAVEARLFKYLQSLDPVGWSHGDIVINPADIDLAAEVIRFCRALTAFGGDLSSANFTDDFVQTMPIFRLDDSVDSLSLYDASKTAGLALGGGVDTRNDTFQYLVGRLFDGSISPDNGMAEYAYLSPHCAVNGRVQPAPGSLTTGFTLLSPLRFCAEPDSDATDHQSERRALVVMFPGLGLPRISMLKFANAVVEGGQLAVMIDLPSFGNLPIRFGFGQKEAGEVAALVDSIRSVPVVLLGYSHGASVSLAASAIGSNLAGVIAIAPISSPREALGRWGGGAGRVVGDRTINVVDRLLDYAEKELSISWSDADTDFYLSKRSAPALIVIGAQDGLSKLPGTDSNEFSRPPLRTVVMDLSHADLLLDGDSEISKEVVNWIHSLLYASDLGDEP